MSVIANNILAGAAGQGGAEAAYQIDRSLRFNSGDSAYLNRTPLSAGNRKTFTFSAWVKLSELGTGFYTIFQAGSDDFRISSNAIGLNNSGTGITASTAVLRDPSAWYHVVLAVDNTQSSNRTKIYVNNEIVAQGNTYSLNEDTPYNNSIAHYIGKNPDASGREFDGYLADVHFIDGQALDPTDFGEYDDNNVWQPKEFAGTYGTNGFYLDFSDNSSNAALGYDAAGSNDWTVNNLVAEQPTTLPGVAFDGSGDYLSIPNDSDFLFGTGDFTLECFASFDNATSGQSTLLGMWGLTTSQVSWLMYRAGSNLTWYVSTNGSTQTDALTVSHGMSANIWNHIAFVRSSGTTTIYVNGVSKGSTSTIYNLHAATCDFVLGYNPVGGTPDYMDGRVSNVRIVKGTAVYTSNFTPPTAPLSNVTNTVLLCCQSSSSATAATVSPGTITANGNASATEFTDSTSANDSLIDTPTNYEADAGNNGGNYCTWNPLDNAGTLANGNLDFSQSSAAFRNVRSTFAVSSGKWYWEGTVGAIGGAAYIGIGTSAASLTVNIGAANTFGYVNDGNKQSNNTASVSYGASYTTGDVIGVAFDADAGTLTFYKNGSSQGQAYSGLTSGPYFFMVTGYNGTTWNANFGQRAFAYTAPSGFQAINTASLPDPTIADGSTAMDVVTYSGTSASRSFTDFNFSPDFAWIKTRNVANDHNLVDIVRGAPNILMSNKTDAEITNSTDGFVSFDSNGFTLGANSLGTQSDELNKTGFTYVAWAWDGGTSTVSNTDGSITSNVRANPSAGFSIVTYSGAGAVRTVGHGLNAAPELIIFKSRTNSENWAVYSKANGAGNRLILNLNVSSAAGSNYFNNTEATSSVFTVGHPIGQVNGSGQNYVAYCFAPVSQYSSFGVYTANGSTDGPFVFTGFAVAWLMTKRTNSTGSWEIHDLRRPGYNPQDERLLADTNDAEAGGNNVDLLSNGFKIRNTFSGMNNTNGDTYIYAAFAEHPFKTARAR